jgi:hypothetical protein
MQADAQCPDQPTRPRPSPTSIISDLAATVNRWVSTTTANATEQAMTQVRRSVAVIALCVAMAVAGCSAYLVFLHELLAALRTWEAAPYVRLGVAFVFCVVPTAWLLFFTRKWSRAPSVKV